MSGQDTYNTFFFFSLEINSSQRKTKLIFLYIKKRLVMRKYLNKCGEELIIRPVGLPYPVPLKLILIAGNSSRSVRRTKKFKRRMFFPGNLCFLICGRDYFFQYMRA